MRAYRNGGKLQDGGMLLQLQDLRSSREGKSSVLYMSRRRQRSWKFGGGSLRHFVPQVVPLCAAFDAQLVSMRRGEEIVVPSLGVGVENWRLYILRCNVEIRFMKRGCLSTFINAPVTRSGIRFDIPTVMTMTFKYSDGIFFDLLTVADFRRLVTPPP